MTAARRRFALDQNFPSPIVAALKESIPEAELVPIFDIDARLARLEDWQLLHALHADKNGWDGLVTNDSALLALPKVIALLIQTKLTLVVADGVGHDPIRATGLLLTHLPWICEHTNRSEPQLWHLHASHRPATNPWEVMRELAKRAGVPAAQHFKVHKLSTTQLKVNPLVRQPRLPGT